MKKKLTAIESDLMQRTHILGVDPSFINLGLSLYNPANKTFVLGGGEWHKGLKWITDNVRLNKILTTLEERKSGLDGMNKIIAVVENPCLDSTTFKSAGMVSPVLDSLILQTYEYMKKNGVHPSKAALYLTQVGYKAKRNFLKGGRKTATNQKTVGLADLNSVIARSNKISQHVGENKAAAKLIIRKLEAAGVPIIEIAPSKRDSCEKPRRRVAKGVTLRISSLNMPTKSTAKEFELLTRYTGQSNEHNRDATTLMYGKPMIWAVNTYLTQVEENGNKPKSFPSANNNNFSLFKNQK